MRKLTAAGILAASVLGVSLQANAATAVYDITGTFGSTEQSCTQITAKFANTDCTFGRNRLAPQPTPPLPPVSLLWLGPLFGGGHYAQDGIKDQVSYVPTSGTFVPAVPATEPPTGTTTPAVDDGKLAAPVTGTFSINDNGTAGDPTDDLISASFVIGNMARNVQTGQNSRAVQRWTTMTHTMAPKAVNATATVANAAGGVDYVIGSRGFPSPMCSATNNADCFPTANVHGDFGGGLFWVDRPAGSIGIEAIGLLGDPAFVAVQPPPNPKTGNVGASSTATFTGYTCSDLPLAVAPPTNPDDCTLSTIVWGAAESPGFDNMVIKISTNSLGAITSALVYWTEEYFIGFATAGTLEVGYDNSWQAGTISFTGQVQVGGPDARNFAASVLQGSSGNTLDTVANSVNFAAPVTVTILTPPTRGTATVNGDNTLNYNSTGAVGIDTLVYQSTDGTNTDSGTITITVAADVNPAAPDGPLSISTAGSAPASSPGSVDVASLGGYMAGNTPSVVSITTARRTARPRWSARPSPTPRARRSSPATT